MHFVLFLLGGFFDPQKALFLLGVVLTVTLSLLCGTIGLIAALIKAKKSKTPLSRQRLFSISIGFFFIAFLAFIILQAAFK